MTNIIEIFRYAYEGLQYLFWMCFYVGGIFLILWATFGKGKIVQINYNMPVDHDLEWFKAYCSEMNKRREK